MLYISYYILLHSIVAIPQINLYYTDLADVNDEIAIQHNCLHTLIFVENSDMNQQIMYFCMSESLSKYHIKTNDLLLKYTFTELFEQNITSQQLYLWSAPIDTIERYQLYLDENNQALSNEIFYNCTLPRFGPLCQYEFDFYRSDYGFLHEMIDSFYSNHVYEPTDFTCYLHLQCYRGLPPMCLDWTEICNGRIDCLDGDIDEQHCWQLEINECKEDERRCVNGQCIPQSFYKEKLLPPDCIDASDELPIFLLPTRQCSDEYALVCEDISCTPKTFTSSCVAHRERLLIETTFSFKDDDVDESCWIAFKCIIPKSNDFENICNGFCMSDKCFKIIELNCPNMTFIPNIPIMDHRIYFAYEKNDAKIFSQNKFQQPYICYNDSHYDKYFINGTKISFKNRTCYRNIQQPIVTEQAYSWNNFYLEYVHQILRSYTLLFNYTSTFCDRSNMYQCINSSKCISIHRLNNDYKDCPYGDDERIIKPNETSQFQILAGVDEWIYDKEKIEKYIRNYILFQTICDGFTELLPITINGKNETDETECEYWQCNNIYTHCNQLWNCLNGADEIDCDSALSKQCSSNEQMCVLPKTNQLICLSLVRMNDGIIDCLGATDEPKRCRKEYVSGHGSEFYCVSRSNTSSCLSSWSLCNNHIDCYENEDERFCVTNQTVHRHPDYCESKDLPLYSDVEKFFCKSLKTKKKNQIVYFALNTLNKSTENKKNYIESSVFKTHRYRHDQARCHRGLDVRVWLDDANNLSIRTCLCPPNFYGDRCQYQNQRVSLALKFQALSNCWETPFAILISLIDDSYERITHSYEQLTYLSMRDCTMKYDMYLFYSTRPKDPTKAYSIHIDVYEKLSLNYHGSLFFPINHPFLPVHRLAYIIDILRSNENIETCHDRRCIHGKCFKYVNNRENDRNFCRCNQGWSGQFCTISHQCTCSHDSLCIGISADNRSICICPIHKFGSRCLIDSVCQSDNNSLCENNGQCIPIDDYRMSKERFTCICPTGFSGERCEIKDNQLILSFDKDVNVVQSIFIHFITVIQNRPPIRTTTFQILPIKQESLIIQWSQPFHLVFIELSNKNYYLAVFQEFYNRSSTLTKTIQSSNRCQHISEIFNQTFVNLHLIRRIKYYHLPCQNTLLNLSCFYDEKHLCSCYNFGQKRLTNCFEFNHQMNFDCSGQSECENGGQCFQDTSHCPQRSMCVCSPCFYGRLCQFSTNGFGLSLDAILSYHIQPKIRLLQQSSIVIFSMVFTVIFLVAGVINGSLSIITFKHKNVREVGCGLYLCGSSITALCTILVFGLKFWILVLTQTTQITNRRFLLFQCYITDFLLRVCLNMDQWLNACVAFERVIIARKGMTFNKKKSQQAAKFVIAILLILIVSTSIHDPLNRRLIVEENDQNDEKRLWCIVTYSSNLQIFNSIVYIFHFFGPFIINFVSAIMLITQKSRQQSNVHRRHGFRQLLKQHARQHKHLFTAPLLLVILALPRLIICFSSKCMKSANDAWLFLIGYFISFIPSILTFLIFIVPSKFYKRHFHSSIAPYQTSINRRLQLIA